MLLLTISPETVLRAHAVRATTAAVPRPLIPSNDRQAAAVAVPLIHRSALALEAGATSRRDAWAITQPTKHTI